MTPAACGCARIGLTEERDDLHERLVRRLGPIAT
jgi:hypothetical protein